MKKDHAEKLRFVDALAKEVRYAILTKEGRVQILVHPTSKQLRKRGKRGWHLYNAVEGETTVSAVLEIVRQAIAELESPALNGVNGDHPKEPKLKKAMAAVRS
jgi:hypothetical protein